MLLSVRKHVGPFSEDLDDSQWTSIRTLTFEDLASRLLNLDPISKVEFLAYILSIVPAISSVLETSLDNLLSVFQTDLVDFLHIGFLNFVEVTEEC